MSKHTKITNQHGSIHAIVIIVLSLCLVVTIGWIFWQNFLQPKEKTGGDGPSPQIAKTATPTSTSVPSPSAQPVDNATYISMSDWGVRFQLTSSLSSTTVHYQQETDPVSDGTTQVLYNFDTDRLASACRPYSGYVVSLIRYKKPLSDGLGTSSPLNNSSPINGYYYYSSYPSTGPSCLDNPDKAALLDSLKSLEAIPN